MINKKTKIVATLGPAISNKETLKELLEEGVNVFRINFSHALHDEIKTTIETIRELNREYNFNAAILADLQGPKIRIGMVEKDFPVKKGEKVNAKQAIGEVFTNQQTGKTQLQFGIFNNVKALNPKDWVYQM